MARVIARSKARSTAAPATTVRHGLAALALSIAACGGGGGSDATDAGSDAARADADRTDAAPGSWWKPAPGTSWQWQLSGTIDTSVDVAMYDVDLVVTPDSVLQRLRTDGRRIVCYFSAGSYENGRDDLADVPAAAIGKVLDGWPDERWFDIRHPAVRAVMTARLDRAVARGCDGVEPDNVDGYANDNGFDDAPAGALTAADQLDFNRFLADEAHARGLSIGLKNDLDQIPDLVASFDWALNEECFQWDECDTLAPFIAAGKAVFHTEYPPEDSDETLRDVADRICADANRLDMDSLVKNLELDAARIACR
jgi:hypothetical protein